MNSLIETIEHKGMVIELHYDQDGGHDCPLDWENGGVQFITFERNSTLSKRHDFSSPDEVEPWAEANGYDAFPLYKYEHGAVAYSTGAFSCPWDSGRVGFVLVKMDEASDHDKRREIAKGLCETVADWCNGYIYGYVVKDVDDEEVDSCWGIYGFEYAKKEATDSAEHFLKTH